MCNAFYRWLKSYLFIDEKLNLLIFNKLLWYFVVAISNRPGSILQTNKPRVKIGSIFHNHMVTESLHGNKILLPWTDAQDTCFDKWIYNLFLYVYFISYYSRIIDVSWLYDISVSVLQFSDYWDHSSLTVYIGKKYLSELTEVYDRWGPYWHG